MVAVNGCFIVLHTRAYFYPAISTIIATYAGGDHNTTQLLRSPLAQIELGARIWVDCVL